MFGNVTALEGLHVTGKYRDNYAKAKHSWALSTIILTIASEDVAPGAGVLRMTCIKSL